MIIPTIGNALKRSWHAAQSSYLDWQWRRLRQQLQHSDRPILAGPWHGEVGFEILYWIPWLRSLRETLKIAPERLIPISCGGSASWYQVPQGGELYALRSAQQVRVENRRLSLATGLMKQRMMTPFDAGVLQDAAGAFHLTDPIILHPLWMFRQLSPFWEGRVGFEPLLRRTMYQFPLPMPALPDTIRLPERFVAMKWYARPTFPYGHETKRLVEGIIQHMASQIPVVLLATDIHTDDHIDFGVKNPNVIRYRDLVPDDRIETNLAVQSAIVAKSEGFIGTYGGFSQMALSLGKPSASFYTSLLNPQTGHPLIQIAHLTLSTELAIRAGVPWVVLRLSDIGWVEHVLPVLAAQHVGPTPLQMA